MTATPDPAPPPRLARLFPTEGGVPFADARFWPFWAITGWLKGRIDFRVGATGQAWLASETRDGLAEIAFTCDRGDGSIHLLVTETGWTRAEVTMEGRLVLRCWIEQCYEELEVWPDGSSGEEGPDGGPPGRISKRGTWLLLRAADFPGVPGNEHGWFALEDVTGNFAEPGE